MVGMIDYHTHTILSDGIDTYEEMIKVAISKGLYEIGFSEHICLKPVEWALNQIDIPVMTEQIHDLQAKYREQIKVRLGIEVDYFPGRENELKELIDSIPADYVIGSVHFIDDWNFDTDQTLFGKWPNDQLYKNYFEIVKQAASSNLFDIMGHLDIIKKFRIYPETNQDNLFEETIRVIKKHNLVVELNTGGIDRPCAEFTPSPKLIKMCYTNDVPVTISSDAHSANQIARHYESAIELLTNIGYTEIAAFKNRNRRMIRI